MYKQVIIDNQEKIKNIFLVKRNIDFNEEILNLNKIISFVWPRRSWKTYFMYQVIKQLIEKWEVEIEQIVFIDFAEIIQRKIDFNKILSSFYEINPDLKPFFIFDEVQDIDNFRQWIIWLFNKWFKIFISWSNSKLLSQEISTEFRWRNYEIFILPLSFKEFLSFKKFELKKFYSTKESAQLKNLFLEYLKYWAYPEIALIDNIQLKEWIIKDYFNLLVYKDLKERYKIDNDYALKYLVSEIASVATNDFSINKVYTNLKNQWLKIWKDTLYNYTEYLQNIFFSKKVSNFQNLNWANKIFLYDLSFMNIFKKNESIEKRFKNSVFLELIRKNEEEIFYKKILNKESDFFLVEKELEIQVSFDFWNEISDKKMRDLIKSNCKNKHFITFDKWNVKDENIKILDFCDFFLIK